MEVEAPSNPTETFTPVTDIEMTNTDTTASLKTNETDVKQGASVAVEGEDATQDVTEAPKTNGESTKTTAEQPALAAVGQEEEEEEDSEMKDALNGTPANNKRASIGGSTKKKSSAVPEHKSKKINRRKSRPLTHLDAQPGEYYFARMKGHPPWPSIMCDEAMLPHSLLSTRPVTAALPDGSFKREDYADGGKRSYERTFPIMFLHTNEFAWIPNTELNPLEPGSEDVTNPSEKGKSKTLLAAYAKAAEANGLEAFKTMLMEHEKAIQEDLALQEERAAKKAEKAKKAAARKSSEARANDDDMDVDEENGTEKPKAKKRKKVADESDIDEKPAKTPKTTTKLKLSTPKQPTEAAAKKKAQKPRSKAPKSGSDEDAETPKVEDKPLTPEEAREIKEKKVLYYRHKLQRGFLSRDATPKAEDMKQMSDFLSELETLPDLESSIIRTTKIHKVLKQMNKIEVIPLEEEFDFKKRSTNLLAKWNDTLSSEIPADDKPEDKAEAKVGSRAESAKVEASTPSQGAVTAVNGESKTFEDKVEPQQRVSEAAVPEAEPSASAETKVGTEVEGKKEADAAMPAETAAAETDKLAEKQMSVAPAEEYKPPSQEAMDMST